MTNSDNMQLAGIPTPRAAGEIQISALPEATTPINENDITNIKQGVEDRKVTVKDLLAPHADKTGNVHNMTKNDLNLGNVENYPITDAVNDMDSQKYASAKAVALVSERLDKQTPVGHILLSLNAANPSTLGYVGTWAYIGQGRALVGFDPNNQQRPVGTEFGSDAVSIGVSNLPAHTFRVTGSVGSAGSHGHSVSIATTEAGAHNHSVNINTTESGAHSHSVNLSTGAAGAHNHSFSGRTSGAGAHSHKFLGVWAGSEAGAEYNSRTSKATTDPVGDHTHDFSGSTSNVGNHSHSVSGNTSGIAGHTHNINGVSGQVSNHIHNVNGNTQTVGDHTHTLDLTSQSVGGNQPISVSQLSLVVYMWARTA